jgi:hypothetical protein
MPFSHIPQSKLFNDIANIVATLRGVLPVQSSIDTVAMKGCNPGADFSRDVAMELKARNIETKCVSLGPGETSSWFTTVIFFHALNAR